MDELYLTPQQVREQIIERAYALGRQGHDLTTVLYSLLDINRILLPAFNLGEYWHPDNECPGWQNWPFLTCAQTFPIDAFCGYSWLFLPREDWSKEDRPECKRLALCIQDAHSGSQKAVDVNKIKGHYVLSNGNHRVYAAYLLGIPEILALVKEYQHPQD
ncbi:MAG TPA: ParB N-terminal domain-containing protein [Thermoanaerobacterium sp.]|nr:ParB N-terminal domain-containing protein [Thermoanaerobacterium sp.]